MSRRSLRDGYHVLGLEPGATRADVRRAFRRLAIQHHPDLHPDEANGAKFREIVAAYKRVQRFLGRSARQTRAVCPNCGRFGELLARLDGGVACADCLLGVTRRRRLLPLPTVRTVKHVAVLALEIAAMYLVVTALTEENASHAAAGFGFSAAAIGFLATTCVRLNRPSR